MFVQLPISTHQEICHDLCSLTCTIYIAHKIALICRSSAADFASGEAQILQLEVHRPSGPFFCLKIYLEEMNLQCSSCYSSLQLYLSLLKIAASKTCHGWPMSCWRHCKLSIHGPFLCAADFLSFSALRLPCSTCICFQFIFKVCQEVISVTFLFTMQVTRCGQH